jgi:hydroxyacylglutathione hydrolase
MRNTRLFIARDEKSEIYRIETEPFGTNAYLVYCRKTGTTFLIDAPGYADTILEKVDGFNVKYILLTHGHMDHITSLEKVYETLDVELAINENDAHMLPIKPDYLLKDGDVISCGQVAIEVMHTPGHTAGSVCFRVGDFLLAGDTIFPGGPGKTETPEDFKSIFSIIRQRIISLPKQTVILPGHGESTTVGKERENILNFVDHGWPEDLHGEITWFEYY